MLDIMMLAILLICFGLVGLLLCWCRKQIAQKEW